MSAGYRSLTDKERETLRLILHGHDAKSMARELDISVHTVNERLRHARRKLNVTSSKEAARLLFDHEADDPQFLGHKQLGEAQSDSDLSETKPPAARKSSAALIGGMLVMLTLVGTLALVTLSPQPASDLETTPPLPEYTQEQQVEAANAARSWLALLDAGEWSASYDRTQDEFRSLNTLAQWIAASQEARVPLGAMVSRRQQSAESVPTPEGYVIVKFATVFENRPAGAVETVTLVEESGDWQIVGVFIE